MEEFLLGLFMFAIGLLILAAIGHGIWLALSAMLRGLFGNRCPNCGHRHFNPSNCPKCAARPPASKAAPRPSPKRDLEAAQRLLQLSKLQSWLPDEQHLALEQVLERLTLRLQSAEPSRSTGGTAPVSSVAPQAQADPVQQQSTQPTQPALSKQEVIAAELLEAPQVAGQSPPRVVERQPPAVPKSAHPLEADYTQAKARAVKLAQVRQRVTADLLRSFMEQSNIRWIELISGALIVICSVGLVISLWSTLSGTSRFFPSLVFLLATLAVHGAGQYTLSQWKLRTTSRGILHIGLMLIPLSVLVGILLARRESGPPPLDAFALAVVAGGALIYGALAVTASRSLFGRRWLVSSVATTVGSFLLVPIFALGQRGSLGAAHAAWLLAPLVAISMWAALTTSRSLVRRVALADGKARVLTGIAVQSIFAVLVAFVFWRLQARQAGGISPGWWLMAGGSIAAWASWGWATSLSGFVKPGYSTSAENKRTWRPNWLIITAWCLASVCSVFLLAAIGQVAMDRIILASILMLLALWWTAHGWLCNIRASLFAGALAAIGAATIGAELFNAPGTTPNLVDWLSFPRIAALTLAGLVTAGISSWYSLQRPQPGSDFQAPQANIYGYEAATFGALATQFLFAGGVAVLAAALLTVLASLVPYGATPYGGNWAALMLMTYGVLAIAGSILSRRRVDIPQFVLQSMMPWGQAVLVLGTVRLCQSSPMLETTLGSLRPARAWAIGLSLLAPGWALLAAAIRSMERPESAADRVYHSHIRFLSMGAIGLTIPSALAIGSNEDHLWLASCLGWTVCLTCIGLFLSWRESGWREALLIAIFAWSGSLVYWAGVREAAWNQLGLASSTAVFVALVSGITLAFDSLVRSLQSRTKPTENSHAADRNWLTRGPFWAAPGLLLVAWTCLLLTSLAPAGMQLLQSVGVTLDFELDDFWNGPIEAPGAAILVLTSALLTGVSAWIGGTRAQWSLTSSTAILPLFTALVAAAWVGSPHAIHVALWVLAGWVMASELIPLRGPRLAELSKNSWKQFFTNKQASAPETSWLTLGRGISIGGLFLGTLVLALAAWTGNLVAADLGIPQLLFAFGPLLAVSSLRWTICVAEGEEPRMIASSGGLAAVLIGCIASIALSGGPAFPNSATVLLQTTALVGSLLAWATIGFALVRNAIGLRAMFGAQLPLQALASKAMRGGRWKKSESAARALNTLAVGIVVCLSIAAAALVLFYPIQVVPGLAHLGGLLAVVTFLTTVGLFCFLASRQEVSRFALLAVSLGMFAPLASASYATWLVADPSRSTAAAANLEPVRSLVVFWLFSLCIGLAVRIAATRQGRSLSKLGQVAWVILACVVAAIALVSTVQDPNPWWPFAELNALALIAVLSGSAAHQSWRGHLAAVAAAAALSSWFFHPGQREILEPLWLVLWGPIWVALVALGWRILWPSRGANATTAISVDQSASLHVPSMSLLLSFVWLVLHPSTASTPSLGTWGIVGLSVACLVLAVSRLWDARRGKRGLSVYLSLLSLAAVLTLSLCFLGGLPKLQTLLLWMASLLGAMAVMAGLLRELVRESSRLGPALKLGSITNDREQYRHALGWMTAAHTCVALLALLPSVVLVLLMDDRTMRVAATALPLLGALTILPIAIQRSMAVYRYVGLLLISVTLVLLWWADLPNAWNVASTKESWIYGQRLFAAMISLAMIYPLCASWLKNKTEWERPLMDFGWITFALGVFFGASLLLGQFTGVWATSAADASTLTKLMSIAAWFAIAARLLQFAARPTGTDRSAGVPLRHAAVYAAEISLVALCGTIYGCYPQLFSGILAAWWPLVMFAIAIASAAIGQWLQRIQQPIIADPVQQSSLLLPLVPLAGVWWFAPEGSAVMWSDWDRYSILLLSAAGLYGLQGWVRESVGLRILSVSLTLASFWSFLHSQPSLRFFEHPQFWLLPPALAALAFVEFNRKRLDNHVVVATRYIAILVGYLSSTAEIFLKAFEGNLWQPLLLLVLALCGVAAGIMLRVQAFLFCGLAFTFIALLGMVWHAQQAIGQVWPWWAFGIATGVGLIVLLGYFEKNRPRVLAYLDQIKRWESL